MEWRKIEGWDAYEVSNTGKVRRGDKIVGKYKNHDGYVIVHLCQNGKDKVYHRSGLVIRAFKSLELGKPEVDHIDGIRDNDAIENLRWADRSEQCINRPNFPLGETQQRNITVKRRKGVIVGFRVEIQRYNVMVYRERFKTLPEAIAARDTYLLNQ